MAAEQNNEQAGRAPGAESGQAAPGGVAARRNARAYGGAAARRNARAAGRTAAGAGPDAAASGGNAASRERAAAEPPSSREPARGETAEPARGETAEAGSHPAAESGTPLQDAARNDAGSRPRGGVGYGNAGSSYGRALGYGNAAARGAFTRNAASNRNAARTANVPYRAWKFTPVNQEKPPSRLQRAFAFLEAFRVTGTDTPAGKLRLYGLGLGAAYFAVYAVCFAALYIPMRTLTARLGFDLSFGLGALAASALGAVLCCISWPMLKQYRRLTAAAYGWLFLAAGIPFALCIALSWGDAEVQSLVILFFARYALCPLLIGGSVGLTLCLWDWTWEMERRTGAASNRRGSGATTGQRGGGTTTGQRGGSGRQAGGVRRAGQGGTGYAVRRSTGGNAGGTAQPLRGGGRPRR